MWRSLALTPARTAAAPQAVCGPAGAAGAAGAAAAPMGTRSLRWALRTSCQLVSPRGCLGPPSRPPRWPAYPHAPEPRTRPSSAFQAWSTRRTADWSIDLAVDLIHSLDFSSFLFLPSASHPSSSSSSSCLSLNWFKERPHLFQYLHIFIMVKEL